MPKKFSDVGKRWTGGGSTKTWHNGKYILKLHRRAIRLFDVHKELVNMHVKVFLIDWELLLIYKKMSEGIDRGRYNFCDCEDVLLRIEDHFSSLNFDRLFRRVGDVGVVVDDGMRKFCVRVGFIEDDVARDVVRAILKKVGDGDADRDLDRF